MTDASARGFEALAALLLEGPALLLTGAGVSTNSGIPDYRDAAGEWKHQRPVQYRDFVGSASTRQRYWARSLVGWEHFRGARPNLAHHAARALELSGASSLLVTQNVDGLHQAAGSENVVDLHGRLDSVVCLSCRDTLPRDALQVALLRENPEFSVDAATIGPDGDSDLQAFAYDRFRVVDCPACGGVLKPDVVFFGETVPKLRVDRALAALAQSKSLLILGSSLMVFSGYRFVKAAQRLGLPIAIVNRGRTRGDDAALVKLEGDTGEVLSAIAERLEAALPLPAAVR